MSFNMMQGDEYSLRLTIKDRSGRTVDNNMVESLEVVVGSIRKTYPEEIVFADGGWLFPLTQAESMQLDRSVTCGQARVKFLSGEVVGRKFGPVLINESSSKEVL